MTYPAVGGGGGAAPGRLHLVLGGILLLASVALCGWYFAAIRQVSAGPLEPETQASTAAAEPGGRGDELKAPVRKAAEGFLAAPVRLRFDGKEFEVSWSALGLIVDEQAVAREATRLAAAGKDAAAVDAEYFLGGERLVPVALDRQKGLEALVGYKDSYDRAPVDARVDLEKRQVIPESSGFGIDVYASLSRVEQTAQAGAHEVELAGGEIQPQVTREKLGNLDVSTVMGWFETRFPVGEKDRNYNLKLAAEKINGHVIMPGEIFSFNAVVGERSEKQGYRVAHVIAGGEMIDGLAGGACQVSSTLHGAAFFAGLELVQSRPHSRPSAYITMGMDATVVWPATDVKLRNPYDFPVAIRYVVSQGTMRVEILGKPRPYDKIVFEREILKEIPYETITREDDTMPIGATIIEQPGFPGYDLVRRRLYYRGDEVVKTEKWRIKYPATTEYLLVGTNPDPNLPQPKQKKPHGPMSPGGRTHHMSQ